MKCGFYSFFQKSYRIYLFACVVVGARSVSPHWLRSEDGSKELVSSSYPVSPRDRSQVVTLGNKCLYVPSLITAPVCLSFCLSPSCLKLEKELILLSRELPDFYRPIF